MKAKLDLLQLVKHILKPGNQCSSFATTSINSLDISGIYPPIPTPFVHSSLSNGAPHEGKDEDVYWEKLASNLTSWKRFPFKGFVVQGSNGEVAYLNEAERVSIVKAVRDQVPKTTGKLILAGAGCESTRATIQMCEQMAAAGADAALVVTPCYYKGGMTNAALISHFSKLADSSPVPVILYSVPANTGIDLAPEVAVHLASHPNIVGMKDSGGDVAKSALIIHKTKHIDNFQFLAGSASFLLATYAVGGRGGICALANVLGEDVCLLEKLFKEHRLVEPNNAVTKKFGVAGLKTAMDWFGFYGGFPRFPLQPLNQQQESELRKAFFNNSFYASQYR